MKRRIPVALTIATLIVASSAFGQAGGYIPQCRLARQTLVNYGLLQTVGTLVKQECPQIHNGVWLQGTGKVDKTGAPLGAGCNGAWDTLAAIPRALDAGKEFVTRNCPPMYLGLNWRMGPNSGAPYLGCQLAIQSLANAGVSVQSGNAVNKNCIQLYQNGWLAATGGTQGDCPTIWNRLTEANQLAAEQVLVSYNCGWLYTNGYAAPSGPIQP